MRDEIVKQQESLLPAREEGILSVGRVGRAVYAQPALGTASPAGRAALGHEAVELLAVLGATDRVDIFGEFALRVVELAALLVEARKLGVRHSSNAALPVAGE